MRKAFLIENIEPLKSHYFDKFANQNSLFISCNSEKRTVDLIEAANRGHCEVYLLDENSSEESIRKRISNFSDTKCESVEIIDINIDVSLLSRRLIAKIFVGIISLASVKNIKVSVFYSLAKYIPSTEISLYPNHYVEPVHSMFSGWSSRPGLPIMTLVGLGYEQGKALGAVEYLESARSIIFRPNSQEDKYRIEVDKQNETFFENASIESRDANSLIDYSVENPCSTIRQIDSIISGYKKEYKLALLPFGPKIFYAASIIASIANPEVSVWRVSGEERQNNNINDRDVVSTFGFSCLISSISS